MRKLYILRVLVLMSFICILINVKLVYNHELNTKPVVIENIESNIESSEDSSLNVDPMIGTKDIVGSLEIKNTDYSTYIVQYSNNSFYLNHDIDRNYSINGTPFLDYRVDIDNSKKVLIYGHNSSKYNMPFKILENYYNKDYYDKHKYIIINTKNNIYKYKIFSVYVETSNFDYIDLDKNNIDEFKNNSIYDTGVNVSDKDDILILQTCSTLKEYKKLPHKFLLVVAKRV